MPNFFKSMFRPSGREVEQAPTTHPVRATITYESIRDTSFQPLVALTLELKGVAPLSTHLDLSRRFYEIALLDDDVSDKDRAVAWEIAEAAYASAKECMSNDSDSLSGLEDARQSLINMGKRFGPGSLSWMIEKEAVPSADVIEFAMRPKHRPLLKSYLEAVFAGERDYESRAFFVRELIWQSDYDVPNAVLVLHGLAAKHDTGLCALFSTEEYITLLKTPEDYGAARAILVDIGLLPRRHGARPFGIIPALSGYVGAILADKIEEVEKELRVITFSVDERELLSETLCFLYIHLAKSQVKQIFGESIASEAFSSFANTQETAQLGSLFTGAHGDAFLRALGPTSLDTALLFAVWNLDGHLSEEDFTNNKALMQFGSTWLNRKRVQFLEYFRFILRALSDPLPKGDSDVDKEVLGFLADVYRNNGAGSAIAENAMNYEDWIGQR